MFFFKKKLPSLMYSKAADLLGNSQMKKQATRYAKMVARSRLIAEHFTHFTTNEWIFDSFRVNKLLGKMSEEELREFPCDVGTLDWRDYIHNFAFGIKRYILKEDVDPPFSKRNNIISKMSEKGVFSDVMWAYKHGTQVKTRSLSEVRDMILASAEVKETIHNLVRENIKNSNRIGVSEEKQQQEQITRAKQIIERMSARLNMRSIRMLAWFFHKAWRNMYERIVINEEALKKLRQLKEHALSNGPLILCPTHRSYVDFLIISYIFFSKCIDVPYICAGEDFLNITMVNQILRFSGAFYMRRSFKDDPLYKAIFKQYVHRLLMDQQAIEFFVEGTRARAGKVRLLSDNMI